jgi:hypothetical protein
MTSGKGIGTPLNTADEVDTDNADNKEKKKK